MLALPIQRNSSLTSTVSPKPEHENGAWSLFRFDAVARPGTDLLMIWREKTALLGSPRCHSWPAPYNGLVRKTSQTAYENDYV